MRPRDIDTNGVSLHGKAVGDRADPAVLLIMGAMSFATEAEAIAGAHRPTGT